MSDAALSQLAHEPDPIPRPVARRPLAIARLTLNDFRSYAWLRLDVDPAPVVLTGPNGAGKTNLLEALSMLAPGRGLRRVRLADMDRRGTDGAACGCWSVAATVFSADGPVEVGTGRDPSDPSGPSDVSDGERRDGRRIVRIDGAPARGQAALARVLSLVWLTPEMDRLFVEGAGARRRFLDRLVYGFDPDHARRVGAYEQAMRERNRLLRESRSGPVADAAWLAALEDRMAREGVAIAAARRAFVTRLGQAAAAGESVFPQAALAMEGEVEDWLDSCPALAAEDRLRDALASARRVDTEAGRATIGPHRGDFTARHLAKDRPAGECSTGEQKALLISIVLADARLRTLEADTPPVLLLDEVAAHLDRDRRAALFDEVRALGAQAWLTGTDRASFEALEGRANFFDVSDGTVRHAKGAEGLK